MTCNDRNPWDPNIRCQSPDGHEGRHEVIDGDWTHRWNDRSHWPEDACRPCTNPRRSA